MEVVRVVPAVTTALRHVIIRVRVSVSCNGQFCMPVMDCRTRDSKAGRPANNEVSVLPYLPDVNSDTLKA